MDNVVCKVVLLCVHAVFMLVPFNPLSKYIVLLFNIRQSDKG